MAAESARALSTSDSRSNAGEDDVPAPATRAPASTVELDRLIHGRVRLGIVSALAVNGSLSFTDLRDLLGTTDGNLSAHARRLEDAGYIVCEKSFEGRTPKTEYELTKTGRKELDAYLDHMEAIIEATRE